MKKYLHKVKVKNLGIIIFLILWAVIIYFVYQYLPFRLGKWKL